MTDTQPPVEEAKPPPPPPPETGVTDVSPIVDEAAIDDLPMGGKGQEGDPPSTAEIEAAQAATDTLPMGGSGESAQEPKG